MNSLNEDELDSLPLNELIQRMDDFLLISHEERYGKVPRIFPVPMTSDIVNTITVRQKTETEIRKIAHLTFSYLVQHELSSISGGFANSILYTNSYTISDWGSPIFRLRDSAISQFQIVSSRIAFEIFIDLLYCIETGKRLSSKKSKLKKFRSWLKDINNKFHYFAHVLLIAYKFDREIRTPEVHGSSSSIRKILTLQTPNFEENNKQFRLTNTLFSVWRPLLDILNSNRPTYMQVDQLYTEMSPKDKEWFHAYTSGNNEVIEASLNKMLNSDDI
jgi:hypothetical protein